MSGPSLFDRAIELLEAGRLAEAETLCRQILSGEPERSGALLLLGVIKAQSGDPTAALPLITRSLGIAPDVPLGHFWHGMVLAQLGRGREALRGYQRAVELDPNFAEAHYNRGHLLFAMNRVEEALAAFERTAALRPAFIEAQCARAGALSRLRRNAEALAELDAVVARHPYFTPALNIRSELLCEMDRLPESLADCERSLGLDPNQAAAHASRGRALSAMHRPAEALAAFDRALSLDPNTANALTMRGVVHFEAGRLAESLKDCERAAALMPNDAAVHANLGNTLAAVGRLGEAIEAFNRALALDARAAKVYHNRATVLRRLNRYEQALADCEQALALDPAMAEVAGERFLLTGMLCDWRERAGRAEDLKRRIREGQTVSPWIAATAIDDPELQLMAARRASFPSTAVPARPPTHERLRIAYLAPDFHEHPSAHLVVELIERHDRARFETFCVSLGPDRDSDLRRRFGQVFEHFMDLGGRSDAEAADLLRQNEIAIAVDLAGHAGGGRPGIFAQRPAPIAVNYAGHPGTMGTDWTDFLLADAVVVTPDSERFFSEKVVRLPGCYLASDTRFQVAAMPARAEADLPEQGFVFCSFNHGYKITPEMFDIWMRLLGAVDGSVLWLLGENETMRRNLRNEAEKRGVAPERLVFANRLPREKYLGRLALADCFLDCSPCNAHTTAADALWRGVPLVTCMGKSFASRVAGSMLTTMGLNELIARDLADYQRIALELAQSSGRMAEVRARLAAGHAGPLFDMAGLARHIESAYETMWKRHAEGLPPAAFDVAAEV